MKRNNGWGVNCQSRRNRQSHLKLTRRDRSSEFDEKSEWIGRQLKRMDADFVGFQEVFHESALEKVAAASGLFAGGMVGAPGANGSGPRVGFATSLPVVDGPQLFEAFPDDLDFTIKVEETGEKISIPIRRFSRPVLKVVVEMGNGHNAAIFVAHLKSKRPLVDKDKRHDPTERAIGKARSLIVRASEAAAFRSLLVQEMQHTQRPVIVLGDLNDAVHAVTSEIVAGTPPWRRMSLDDKRPLWDVLLYSTYDIQARNSYQNVSYSHIHIERERGGEGEREGVKGRSAGMSNIEQGISNVEGTDTRSLKRRCTMSLAGRVIVCRGPQPRRGDLFVANRSCFGQAS